MPLEGDRGRKGRDADRTPRARASRSFVQTRALVLQLLPSGFMADPPDVCGTGAVNAPARRGLRTRGLDSGRLGTWLAARRVLVRVILAVLAVLWLILLRPIGFGDIFLVLLTTLLVIWVLELLQRRAEDIDPDATGAAVAVEEPPARIPN